MRNYAIAAIICAVCLSALPMQAESILRYNYKSNGYIHTSAEYELVKVSDQDQHPFWTRLERVEFPNGSTVYLLYMNFEEMTSHTIPKGVKLAVNLPSGKFIRTDQIGNDLSSKRSFTNSKGRFWWNRAKYAFEESDIKRMTGGIKSIDVVTGWEPDDYIQVVYNNDELGKVIASQYKVITAAPKPTSELPSGAISRYADNNNSITIIAKPRVARGSSYKYNVGMTYLYYKTSNREDFDVNFQIGTDKKYSIPLGSKVEFTLSDGSILSLSQTSDETNQVRCYPTVAEVRKMMNGIKAVRIETASGTISDTILDDSFAEALRTDYQVLMSASTH